MANPSYTQAVSAGAYPNAIAAPKEIGYLQRLSGVTDGLMAIEDRLQQFADRLAGNGGPKEAGPVPSISGNIDGMLTNSEQRIRSCLQLLGQINDAF